jgi:hypothetical protein
LLAFTQGVTGVAVNVKVAAGASGADGLEDFLHD